MEKGSFFDILSAVIIKFTLYNRRGIYENTQLYQQVGLWVGGFLHNVQNTKFNLYNKKKRTNKNKNTSMQIIHRNIKRQIKFFIST